MTRYSQIAREHHRRHRPRQHKLIAHPEAFFAQVGEQIQAEITSRRDEILGPSRQGETPEEYRLRSYQALATAEELTLAEHYLLQPEEEAVTDEDDPILQQYAADLDAMNRTILAASRH